ncbi:MAG: hypothetical protein HGB12_10595 [Bacteroidetes bacterium]|nr:hypothetical protein [Bacteroidota bacterium]
MLGAAQKNPGLPEEAIHEWVEKIGCRPIETDKLEIGSFYLQLVGKPDISAKLFVVLEKSADFVVKAHVVDIIHNDDVVEHEHHFKWGDFPEIIDFKDLYHVPLHVGAEFINMAQFYSQSEDAAWG